MVPVSACRKLLPILAALIELSGAAQPGALDTSFDPGPGANDWVSRIGVQGDGRIIAAGAFTMFNGSPSGHIVRLNTDGSVDGSFLAGAGFNGSVTDLKIQPDDKILACGDFTQFDGTSLSTRLVRLNSDGTLDAGFSPPPFGAAVINSIALQTDGKILLGGFMNVFSPQQNRVCRLASNGSPDASFSTGAGPDATVNLVAALPDGRIFVAGNFSQFSGTPRTRLCVLGSDGTLDLSFDPADGPNANISALAVLPDGRVVLGGPFTLYAGSDANRCVRVLANGAMDPSFDTGTGFSGGSVQAMELQPDGSLLVGGSFLAYDGIDRSRICRLGATGALDPAFDPGIGPNQALRSIITPPGFGPLISGGFTAYSGTPRAYVARLLDCTPSTWYLDADGDGFGNMMAPTLSACTQPAGYSADNSDCNDSDAAVHTQTFWYADSDMDGYGDAAISQFACSQPMGHVADSTDCDDQASWITGPQVWFADVDGDGLGDPLVSQLACIQPPNTSSDGSDCDDSDPLIYPFALCDDGNPTTYFDEYNEDCVCTGQQIRVSPVVWLEGANTSGALMRGNLYNAGLIPLQEPYTALGHTFVNGGGETTSAAMLNPFPGNDELMAVDWVIVELRDRLAPNTVLESHACILRRNGVVHRAGTLDPPQFSLVPDFYFVAVKHRNHLGLMTANPISVNSPTPPYLDFAFGQEPTYGTDALQPYADRNMMRAGDAVRNKNVKYSGAANDRDRVLSRIGGIVPTNVVAGYFTEDVNLDGLVKYSGTANDRDVILQSIGGVIPTAVRVEQIPE